MLGKRQTIAALAEAKHQWHTRWLLMFVFWTDCRRQVWSGVPRTCAGIAPCNDHTVRSVRAPSARGW